MLGALGECMEMIYSVLTLPHATRTRASWNDLVASLGRDAVADPLTLGLPAGSPVDRDTHLDWVEGRRPRDGATVLVPIDVVALNQKELAPGYDPFATLITNGMGAGPDIEWAVGHGLAGAVAARRQRADVQGPRSRCRARPARPAAARGRDDPRAARACRHSRHSEIRHRRVRLANVYCVGLEADGREPPLPIMVTACGEACHPDRERALVKAMCEFAASRVRKAFAHGPRGFVRGAGPRDYIERFMRQSGSGVAAQEGRAFTTMRDWSTRRPAEIRGWLADSVHAVRDRKAFTTLPHTPVEGSRAAGRIARERVEAAGIDVLYVDFSPPGAPVSVVKVIAPGLEVETMSYGRIGERNTRKLIERGDPLIKFGMPSDTLKPVRLTPEALARFGGQPLFDSALAERIVGPLYPLYREPEAHHVAAAEAMAAE